MPAGAVLFDLDDTLFDYTHAARVALGEAARLDPVLAAAPFDALAQRHHALLEEIHPRVTRGELALDAARSERFTRLLIACGGDPAAAPAMADCFRAALRRAERLVPGAARLLDALQLRGVTLAIVSNNTRAEQIGKLTRLGCIDAFAAIVVSADHGISKPDPRLFAVALDQLGVAAADTVHVGDDWDKDIDGARRAGIRPVWFNRFARPAPETDITQLDDLGRGDAVERILAR